MELMSSEEFKLLNDFITEKCGISYNEKQKYIFQQKIIKRLEKNGLNTFKEYYYLLKYSPTKDELQELYNVLTVNETYFFREKEHLISIVDSIIPEMLKVRPNRTIKILSAGCSTGEEPFTLGMLIKESKHHIPVNLNITAIDISKKAIEMAQSGTYRKISLTFRAIDKIMLTKYFELKDESYKLKDEIRNFVTFKQANFFDNTNIVMNEKFDIIICRNVMIYFNNFHKEELVNKFYNNLSSDGFLILSNTENLNDVQNKFKLIKKDNVFIYSK